LLGVAVVGPGRAGRARIAALEDHPRARLVATVARSGAPTLEDALADPRVEAVIVSTPNALHAAQVGATLDAGRHVAVEYPLAATPGEARELFARSDARGRALHVEHIELLSASQRHQRERAAALGPPLRGELRLTASLGDESDAGSVPLRAVARLHRLLDLFGPARVAAAALDTRAAGHELRVDLDFERGGSVRLVETRGPSMERTARWSVECEKGVLEDPPPGSERGLFRADLDHFLDRIETGADPYVSRERVIEVLELVEAIERACS
jgi:biliverdin reductase